SRSERSRRTPGATSGRPPRSRDATDGSGGSSSIKRSWASRSAEGAGALATRGKGAGMDQERLLKRVWLVNGVLLLALLGALGIWLLLNRPALIRSVSFPRSRDDSLQSWITYEVAFDDTNGDGGLDEDDAVSLYVSDLHGAALHPVLPPEWSVLSEEPLGDGRHILVLAVQPSARTERRTLEQAPAHAVLHDVPTVRTEP